MKLRTVKKIAYILLGVLGLFMLLWLLMPRSIFGYMVIGAIPFIGIFIFAFWRCPNCGKCLGQMEMGNKAKYCRYCGEEIDL